MMIQRIPKLRKPRFLEPLPDPLMQAQRSKRRATLGMILGFCVTVVFVVLYINAQGQRSKENSQVLLQLTQVVEAQDEQLRIIKRYTSPEARAATEALVGGAVLTIRCDQRDLAQALIQNGLIRSNQIRFDPISCPAPEVPDINDIPPDVEVP